MLQEQTVTPGTLAILNRLMALPELSEFHLAGGTALSLQYGHRKSIDLDLFSKANFSIQELASILEKEFPNFSYLNSPSDIGLFGFIDNIKVDFIRHINHPLIKPPCQIDGIRFLSNEDIVAMKLNAILRRAVKKDFWDIAELLDYYQVHDMISFYTSKYPSQQLLISIPLAMVYFDDAEDSEEPISLNGQTWDMVKKKIQVAVQSFLS